MDENIDEYYLREKEDKEALLRVVRAISPYIRHVKSYYADCEYPGGVLFDKIAEEYEALPPHLRNTCWVCGDRGECMPAPVE